MKYKELAEWLTFIGYETTDKEVGSARTQKLALACVPATDEVMILWRQLHERFPDADLQRLLVETKEQQ